MHQPRERGDPFRAEHIARADQHPRDQQLQVLVEVLPHALELRRVQCARRLQSAREQRQPAVAVRQHIGNELAEAAPALVVDRKHPVDGRPEHIARLVTGCRIGKDLKRGSRAGGYGQLAREPCVERVDGLDPQARRLTFDVKTQGAEVPARGRGQSPGLAIQGRRTAFEARGAERQQHAFAHLLRGTTRESERQDTLRRIDHRQQA